MTTRLQPEQIQLLKDELTVELAGFLVDDFQLSPQEAIEMLYTSETFERLQDNNTGLYYQSAGYVYSFLQNEIKNAKAPDAPLFLGMLEMKRTKKAVTK